MMSNVGAGESTEVGRYRSQHHQDILKSWPITFPRGRSLARGRQEINLEGLHMPVSSTSTRLSSMDVQVVSSAIRFSTRL
jgi:hypothetical protein